MSHEHIHHTVEERDGGLGTGMVLGVMIALLMVVLAAVMYFGGFFAASSSGGGTDGGEGGGAGTSSGESAPASYQYLVPDYQLAVR